MRMTTQVQQLNAFNGQAQHQEMIRGGRFRGYVVGKLSFEPNKLQENIQTFIDFINSLKPQVIKGTYVRGIAICATMSPSIRIAA